VATVAANLRQPVAWLHSDSGDAQLSSFFHFLGLAIASALPSALGRLPVYGPELEAEVEHFARRFARTALEAAGGSEVCLAIDNLQDIPSPSRVHLALAAIVEEMAGAWRIFLITREGPAPAYTRLLGQGRLTVIAPHDVAFKEPELKEALRERGILDETRLETLWRKSQGWIAGALLLALAPEDEGAPNAAPSVVDPASVLSYFADQAFSRVDPDDRHLLVRTCHLPTVRPETASVLAGLPDASRRLAALASRGNFVSRIGTDDERFRYHDLFRDFLKSVAASTMDPGALADLKRSSARCLASGGDPLPALELLVECGDWGGFRDVLMARAEQLLDEGHFRSLSDLFARIPEAEYIEDPWLLYWMAQCRSNLSDADAATLLIRAAETFSRRGDPVGELVAGISVPALMRSNVQFQFDYRAWIERIERLLAHAWEVRSPLLALKVAAGLASLASLSERIASETDRIVARVVELLPQVKDANSRLQAATQVVGLAWRCRIGHAVPPVAAVVEAQRLEELASPLIVLHWLYDLITFDSMYGDFARADLNARRCGDIAKATGLAICGYEALLLGLEVACDRNRVEEARRLLEELARSADPSRPVTFAWLHGFGSRIALLEDAPGKALAEHFAGVDLLRKAGAPLGFSSASFTNEAGAHALAGRWDDALTSCREWRQMLAGPHKEIVDVYAAWIRAAAAIASDDAHARQLLADAVSLARARNFPLPLRFANRLAASICARAMEWAIDTDFVTAMIARRGLAPPDYQSRHWPWPLRIHCMGGFRIERNGEPLAERGRSQKTVELLQVAIANGGSAPVERIVKALWPGEGRVGAQQAFDTTLFRLRKLLGSESCLELADRQLSVNRREVWVDALAIDSLLSRPDGAGSARDAAAIPPMVALYPGHFLPHRIEEPWAASMRDRLWSHVRRAAIEAARRSRDGGDSAGAERLLYFVIDRQPAAEDAFAELVRLSLARGQPGEAMHAYRRCAAALASEFGVEPGREIKDLVRGIGDSARPAAEP